MKSSDKQAVAAMVAEVQRQMRAGELAADALLNAAGDESDLPTLAAHLERNPPDAWCIAHLVWKARNAGEKRGARAMAKRGTDALHAPTRDAKAEVLKWWAENGKGKMSKEAAADAMNSLKPRLVNETRSTIRDWLKNA